MNLRDHVAVFHLSAEGQQSLVGLVPEGPSFEALVLEADETGAWIVMGRGVGRKDAPTVPVTLLKWDYIASVAFERKIEIDTESIELDL